MEGNCVADHVQMPATVERGQAKGESSATLAGPARVFAFGKTVHAAALPHAFGTFLKKSTINR